MGFRELRKFNTTLLAKQDWRLIQDPNSLVARVLKAKYYATTSFLEAKIGHNPSYVWQSLLAGHDLSKRGIRGRIGDGRDTHIWDSSWIPDDLQAKVSSPIDFTLPTGMVMDLILPDGKWNHELVQNTFNQRDYNLILFIPRRARVCSDGWFWFFDRRGIYSVRSGYKVLISDAQRTTAAPLLNWNLIWGLQIMPKVKNCIWRILADCLPTMSNLVRRHSTHSDICPICATGGETESHMLVHCCFALEVWKLFFLDDRMAQIGNVKEWLWDLLNQPSEEDKVDIAMVLWGLWRHQNEVVWEKRRGRVVQVVMAARWEAAAWRQAHESFQQSGQRRLAGPAKWIKPPLHSYCCNVDAGVFVAEGYISMGFILRDHEGVCLFASNGALDGVYDPELSEALAIKEALSWIKASPYRNIHLQSDCLSVVQDIQRGETTFSYLADVIGDCVTLLVEIEFISISFVLRSANAAAHSLARAVSSLSVRGEWNCPPPFLNDVLLFDSS